MSRVERVDTPTDRRSHQPRQAERGRVNRRVESPGRTPGKAEGEEGDVEEALERTPE
jgi:hypothetical protein